MQKKRVDCHCDIPLFEFIYEIEFYFSDLKIC